MPTIFLVHPNIVRSTGILCSATAIPSLATKTKASTIKLSVRVRCSAATCPASPRFPTSRNPHNRAESPKSSFNECVFWVVRARYGVKGGATTLPTKPDQRDSGKHEEIYIPSCEIVLSREKKNTSSVS